MDGVRRRDEDVIVFLLLTVRIIEVGGSGSSETDRCIEVDVTKNPHIDEGEVCVSYSTLVADSDGVYCRVWSFTKNVLSNFVVYISHGGVDRNVDLS